MSWAATGIVALNSIPKKIAGKNPLRIACILSPRTAAGKLISLTPAKPLVEISAYTFFVVQVSMKSQSQSTPIPGDSGGWA